MSRRLDKRHRAHSLYVISGPLGPCYVGCTGEALQRRWQKHLSAASAMPVCPINKHMAAVGVDLFTVELVAQSPNYWDGLDAERLLIAQLKRDGSRLLNADVHTQRAA